MDGSDSADGSAIKPFCALFARMDWHLGHQSDVRYHHVRHGAHAHSE